MSGYLLDTNVALIATADPERLPLAARTALVAGPNFLSVISYWEVVIKSMKGMLKVGDPKSWWRDTLDQLAAVPLALRPEHVAEIQGLAPFHRDPFDRMLVAQATAESLELVSTDNEILRYASARLRVVG